MAPWDTDGDGILLALFLLLLAVVLATALVGYLARTIADHAPTRIALPFQRVADIADTVYATLTRRY